MFFKGFGFRFSCSPSVWVSGLECRDYGLGFKDLRVENFMINKLLGNF